MKQYKCQSCFHESIPVDIEEGSILVCTRCGTFNTFDSVKEIRIMTDEELQQFKIYDEESYEKLMRASYFIKNKEEVTNRLKRDN